MLLQVQQINPKSWTMLFLEDWFVSFHELTHISTSLKLSLFVYLLNDASARIRKLYISGRKNNIKIDIFVW